MLVLRIRVCANQIGTGPGVERTKEEVFFVANKTQYTTKHILLDLARDKTI